MKFYITEKPCEEAKEIAEVVRDHLVGASHQHSLDPHESDIIVSVGGDGTLFHTIGSHLHHGKPFIGVNGGTLGYRCVISKDNLAEVSLHLDDIPYSLSVFTVEWAGKSDVAVQDVRVERLDHRALRLAIKMAGETISNVHLGDGILVANALGSTGYNSSVGGREIPLSEDIAVVVPVSPFPNKFFDSLLTAIELSGKLEIIPTTRARLVLDDRAFEIEAGTTVCIKQMKNTYKLISMEEL